MSLFIFGSSNRRKSVCVKAICNASAPLRRWKSTGILEPLRILFCGSDEFSCASLRAVHSEQERNPDSIASINVMCRPSKLSGRGLKTMREVPIKAVARELGLPWHEQDTFTGWSLPRSDINLIVAVSFGLFVPPRILKSAKYGGINVHPSLLPEFRGPAPLHHVLIAGEPFTGVTLQTLHPEKFDHGAILAQTPLPGLKIPNQSTCTVPELIDFIGPKAADMLVQGLRDRIFVPPIRDLSSELPWQDPITLRHAPKITTGDRRIQWDTMTATEICRRDRALGRLWGFVQLPERNEKRRIVFNGLEVVQIPQELLDWQERKNGSEHGLQELPFIGMDGAVHNWLPFTKDGSGIVVPTQGKEALLIKEITKDGDSRKPAIEALVGMKILSRDEIDLD